jgi:hypothetical protein
MTRDEAERMVTHFRVREWDSEDPLATPYPDEYLDRWVDLAKSLVIIRDTLGVPVKITPNGGYRNEMHNKHQGGQPNSQHKHGRAADIQADWIPADQVHGAIVQLIEDGELPGVSGLGSYPTFTHVDVGGPRHDDGTPRRWSGGRTAS